MEQSDLKRENDKLRNDIVNTKLDGLEKLIETQMSAINRRMDHMDTRLDNIEKIQRDQDGTIIRTSSTAKTAATSIFTTNNIAISMIQAIITGTIMLAITRFV